MDFELIEVVMKDLEDREGKRFRILSVHIVDSVTHVSHYGEADLMKGLYPSTLAGWTDMIQTAFNKALIAAVRGAKEE